MDERFVTDPQGGLMLFWGIRFNPAETNAMKDPRAHTQAPGWRNAGLRAQQVCPARGPEGAGQLTTEEHP